jgi:hypothetical protein
MSAPVKTVTPEGTALVSMPLMRAWAYDERRNVTASAPARGRFST